MRSYLLNVHEFFGSLYFVWNCCDGLVHFDSDVLSLFVGRCWTKSSSILFVFIFETLRRLFHFIFVEALVCKDRFLFFQSFLILFFDYKANFFLSDVVIEIPRAFPYPVPLLIFIILHFENIVSLGCQVLIYAVAWKCIYVR